MSTSRIQYNGITIEDTTSFRVTEMSGHDTPPVRTSSDILTAQDGGNVWEQKYNMRTISIIGTIFGTSVSDYFTKRREITNAFSINDTNLLTIRLWDSTERVITAYVQEPIDIVDKTGESDHAPYRVQLLCPNPFFTDTTTNTYNLTFPTGGGFPVPSVVPTPVGGTSGNNVIITNSGDVSAYPVITISNTCQNPTITNRTTGEYITFTTTLVDGESISAYHTSQGLFYTKSDGTNLMSVKTGTLPLIQVGVNDMYFTATSGSTTTTAQISYVNNYLTA